LRIYLDTSAFAKLYRTECGTPKVEQLVLDSAGACVISRLGIVEIHSALAQRTRTGELSLADAVAVMRRFREDIRLRRFRVVALSVRHYESAATLVDKYGPGSGLRTLDSLHLAIALDMRSDGLVDSMIAADKVLCLVAQFEGLNAVDPELPA
jgi:predicted nucleic acid-binding protein